jgi:hypothetical protein
MAFRNGSVDPKAFVKTLKKPHFIARNGRKGSKLKFLHYNTSDYSGNASESDDCQRKSEESSLFFLTSASACATCCVRFEDCGIGSSREAVQTKAK